MQRRPAQEPHRTRKFAAMQAAYESFRQEGRLPATFEVVFAHAWVPAHRRGATMGTQRACRSKKSSVNCAPGAINRAITDAGTLEVRLSLPGWNSALRSRQIVRSPLGCEGFFFGATCLFSLSFALSSSYKIFGRFCCFGL